MAMLGVGSVALAPDGQRGGFHALHQVEDGAALAPAKAIGDEVAHGGVVKPGAFGSPLGLTVAPQAPDRPVLGPQVQRRVVVGRGGRLVLRVWRFSPQPEGGKGLVGGVCWGIWIVLVVVGGESVGGFELATRPLARDRYEFFSRPAVPPEATTASM